MSQKSNLTILALLIGLTALSSCSQVADWPDSPLYSFDQFDPLLASPAKMDSIKSLLVGHYAHYDVVAYEDTTTRTTMRSFIISYGFTEFYLEEGKLMQSDRFVHAEQKLSNTKATSTLSDKAVQAIKPRVQEIELSFQNGIWQIYRPETPSLLGINGDPLKPLSKDPNDPNLTDPDQDGNPGVTVTLSVGSMLNGEIYITRREIFSNFVRLNSDGSLSGHVVDRSEQFVIGASKRIFNQPSNSRQVSDLGLSPLLLVPISDDVDTLEELMQIRDDIFPEEPAFITDQK